MTKKLRFKPIGRPSLERSRALSTLSLGFLTHDIYPSGTYLGGAAFYSGQTFHKLGARSWVYTTIGDDFGFEREIENLHTYMIQRGSTTSFANHYDEQGVRKQVVDAGAPPVDPRGIPSGMRSPDILLVCPVLGEVDLHAALKVAKAKLIGVGLQGYLRKIDVTQNTPSKFKRVMTCELQIDIDGLKRLDVVGLSEDDIVGQTDLIEFLCRHVKLVALTRGQSGCELFYHGSHVVLDAYPVDRVVDPTGAGDCFMAGLLYGLAIGRNPIEAAKLGMACGSIVIQARAGEALDRISEAWLLINTKNHQKK